MKKQTPFQAALAEWLENHGHGSQKFLADQVGISPQAIQKIASTKTEGSLKTRQKISAIISDNYESAIKRGLELLACGKQAGESVGVKIDLDHHNIIDQFKDKLTALAINRELLEIEKISREAFIELAHNIIGRAALIKSGHQYNNISESTPMVAEKKTY